MTKRLFRMVSVLLCLAMIFAMAACTPKAEDAPAETEATEPEVTDATEQEKPVGSMPLVDEPLTLTIMVQKEAVHNNFSEMLVWKEYEEMTGVHIEWIEVSGNANEIKEQVNLTIASGELPDIFMKINFNSNDVQGHADDGVFMQLDLLIDEYGVNIKEALATYEDVDKGIRMSDESIYSLPYIMDVVSPTIIGKIFIYKDWLDQTGLPMPTTTDEYYEVLKAMKEIDFNGNGEADEIPLTSTKLNPILFGLRGAFGLGNLGNPMGNVDLDPDTGKLRFWPADDNYKEFLMYLNKLYTEELLDTEIFTRSSADLAANGSQGLVGSFIAINNNFVGAEHMNNYEGTPVALEGPAGDQINSGLNARLWKPASFAISTTCENPEIAMQWVDYFYGEEGMKLYFMGIEDETFTFDENGKAQYLDEIANNPDGLSFDQSVGLYVPWAGSGGNPTIAVYQYFSGAAVNEVSQDAAEKLIPYLIPEVVPSLKFTDEEYDTRSTIEPDLKSYVEEMRANFIIGAISFDEWDEYIATLEQMGMNDYVEATQTAYERYIGD